MPAVCSMKLCHNKYRQEGKQLSFLTFPRDQQIFQIWAERCRKHNLTKHYKYVCEEHFKETDIHISISGRKYLLPGAIPKLILKAFSEHKAYRREVGNTNEPQLILELQKSPHSLEKDISDLVTMTILEPQIFPTFPWQLQTNVNGEFCHAAAINKFPDKIIQLEIGNCNGESTVLAVSKLEDTLPDPFREEEPKINKPSEPQLYKFSEPFTKQQKITLPPGSKVYKLPDLFTKVIKRRKVTLSSESRGYKFPDPFMKHQKVTLPPGSKVYRLPDLFNNQQKINPPPRLKLQKFPNLHAQQQNISQPLRSEVFKVSAIPKSSIPRACRTTEKICIPTLEGCDSGSSVCPHYVALIEEKAKSHCLERDGNVLKIMLKKCNEELEKLKEEIRILKDIKMECDEGIIDIKSEPSDRTEETDFEVKEETVSKELDQEEMRDEDILK